MKIKVITGMLLTFFLTVTLTAYKLPVPFCTTSETSPVSANSVSSLGGERIRTYENVVLFVIDINNDNYTEKAVGYPNPLPLPNPCGDVRFRHALWHLMNRSHLTSGIWNGTYVPQYTVLPYPEYKHTDIKPNRILEDLTHPYNFEEANAIFDEAGYTDKNEDTWRDNPDGSDITLIFYTREDDPNRAQLAEWYTDQLNAARIKVDLRIENFSICQEAVMTNKTHHLYTGGWSLGQEIVNFEPWMSDYYSHPDVCNNYNRVNCTEFDEAASLFNETRNVGDGYEVQEIFNNESYGGALGVIPVCAQVVGPKQVHNVDTGLDYCVIQNAVDAPETLDGHTILVDAGTYYEKIVIDKALTLMGESRSNTIINGSGLSYTGALVKTESDNVTISRFTVTNSAHQGIEVEESQYCEVHDNIVCFTGERGIVFGSADNNKAYNNVVHNSSAYGGIEAIHGNNNTIYNNIAYFNQWGIATNHGSYNEIFNNIVHSNRGTGIHIDWASTGNIIQNNNISANTNAGIGFIHQAITNVIGCNVISGSIVGIHLHDSAANSFSGNYIMSNRVGINLISSENNTLHNNNFIDNIVQVQFEPSRYNVWDFGYPSGGNYWSDYTGRDLYSGPYQNETGSDGIGDIPYTIDANNTDGYPLMRTRYYEDRRTQVVSTESTGGSSSPSLAVSSDGIIHVTWFDQTDYGDSGTDHDIFYKRFVPDTGWTSTEVVSTESTKTSYYPSLAVDSSGNVHIAWHDYTNYEESGTDADIFYKAKVAGNFWTDTEVVSTESTGNSLVPSLAVDSSGNVHIAWHDPTNYEESGTDWDIFYKQYRVGSGWTTTEVVSTESTHNSFRPSLAVNSSGNVHIAWYDITNYEESGTDADIFYKARSVGNFWTDTEVVSTESTDHSQGPSLATDQDGNIHVSWYDNTNYDGCGNDSDIFYKRHVAVAGWTATEVVSTESTGNSYHPSLGVDRGGNVHVAWHDSTNYTESGGDKDVFYKRYEFSLNWTSTEVVSAESKGDSYNPSLAVDPNGNVHIAWHDYTDYAGSGNEIDIFYKYIRVHSTVYPWSMFRHDPRHTGYTQSPAPRTNQTLWNYTTGYDVHYSSPAVADGMVFVGSIDNKVYALDQHTGTHIWNHTTGGLVESSPAVADGRVYVGSADDRVYCLNAYTGVHIWNYTTGYDVFSSPAVADGRVYVGSYDDKVYCLDALTGAHVWNYTTGGGVWSSPAVADGRVYVGSDDDRVYCLDAYTGAHIWNHTTGFYVQASPAVADGRVYVGSYDDKVYCLDALTGAHVWNYTTGSYVFSSPAVADGRVYVGSADDRIYCLDASNGAHVWNYTTGGSVYSSPAVADGVLFIGSRDHAVYAFGCVIRVPEDYPTVQEAIDAAEGTIILIAPGVYHENLVINKTLTILGRTGSSPIFDGGGSGIAVILLPGASGSTVTNIVITNYDQGILVIDSNNCKIYDNIMSLMGYSGIALEGENAKNNSIYSNIFQDNPVAINITASATDNTIYNNTISLNTVGLNLESSGNTIHANTITENEVGINMTNCEGNTIYLNSFINNDVQAINEASLNTWDSGYPDGGNYWSDFKERYADVEDIYSGQHQDETGSDGIWDHPYVIDESNQDKYPLTKPYGGPCDVGITEVRTSKTVVCQGYQLTITVKVLNYGIKVETFNVTVYAYTTVINEIRITLESRNSTTVTFLWSTTGMAKGNYTLKAVVDTVPSETDVEDNTLIDGWLIVAMIGDLTGPDDCPDGKCNIKDVALVAKLYGVIHPDQRYDANCDLTGPTKGVPDGKIDIKDVALVAKHFGDIDP